MEGKNLRYTVNTFVKVTMYPDTTIYANKTTITTKTELAECLLPGRTRWEGSRFKASPGKKVCETSSQPIAGHGGECLSFQ
jgi:hypothetical protein